MQEITFMAAYIENSVLYGAGYRQNIFFQFDLNEKKLEQIGVFDKFNVFDSFSIQEIFRFGDNIYCFSNNSYEIVAYQLKLGTFTYFHHPDYRLQSSNGLHCICRVRNSIWMFRGVQDSNVVEFSMENNQYSTYSIDINKLQNFNIPFDIRFETCVCINNEIWRCIPGNNAFLVLDTETLEVKIITLEVDISSYTISYKNEELYVLDENGTKIIVWNKNTKKSTVWETGYRGLKKRAFREVIRVDDKVFLIPCSEDEIYYYKILKNQIIFQCCIKYPSNFKRIFDEGMFIHYSLVNENKLYLFPISGNGMLCLNIDTFEMEFFETCMPEKDFIINGIQTKISIFERQINLLSFFRLLKDININKVGYTMHIIGNECWKIVKNL